MSQVFLYLPFRDTQGVGELMRRHRNVTQQINDALARGSFGRQHGEYGKHSREEKPVYHTRILGEISEVVGVYGILLVAQQRSFCQNDSLHRLSHHDQPSGPDQSFAFPNGFTRLSSL